MSGTRVKRVSTAARGICTVNAVDCGSFNIHRLRQVERDQCRPGLIGHRASGGRADARAFREQQKRIAVEAIGTKLFGRADETHGAQSAAGNNQFAEHPNVDICGK